MRNTLRHLLATALLSLSGLPVLAEPVSASMAEQRLQDGAQAWDLRADAAALLPGAVRLDGAALLQADAAALARAVSAAGIDLSRDVLIYGEPGDARALQLHRRLAGLASGRVDWLVGGAAEWQMSGRQTVSQASTRLPVPQVLVAWDAGQPAARGAMAAASLRDPAALAAPALELAAR
ncbi:hypothetical protein G8A07_21595 [Roseateles sp. DAIF2]|uniref:hypothetical protein n=1 Tax=Roseateles sp. DAIF2 TaxID=2714952 RepID=UPI0018A2E03D|nr:hypothetical protein [Roseateles sp. DAIF2]QPF75254.1 hypothetical protein G8A07_21595 [Roseateles sp. DAIF2]